MGEQSGDRKNTRPMGVPAGIPSALCVVSGSSCLLARHRPFGGAGPGQASAPRGHGDRSSLHGVADRLDAPAQVLARNASTMAKKRHAVLGAGEAVALVGEQHIGDRQASWRFMASTIWSASACLTRGSLAPWPIRSGRAILSAWVERRALLEERLALGACAGRPPARGTLSTHGAQ